MTMRRSLIITVAVTTITTMTVTSMIGTDGKQVYNNNRNIVKNCKNMDDGDRNSIDNNSDSKRSSCEKHIRREP